MARLGMVIDLKRCIGCNACTMACRAENATPAGVWWAKVLVQETGTYPSARILYTPVLCMHCAEAPCADVCPTGATSRQPNGIVTVDYNKCIGCKYCQTACPYGARTFIDGKPKGYYAGKDPLPYEKVSLAQHQAGVVEKCNFCAERVDQGLEPSCVNTCPAYARIFGDLDDPNSDVSKLIAARNGYTLKPELGTKPSVYYLPP